MSRFFEHTQVGRWDNYLAIFREMVDLFDDLFDWKIPPKVQFTMLTARMDQDLWRAPRTSILWTKW